MATTTFIAYRNGTEALERRIKLALAAFHKSFGRWPAAVVVPSSEIETAAPLVADLGVGCEVRGSGGCLVPEVWLEVGAGDG